MSKLACCVIGFLAVVSCSPAPPADVGKKIPNIVLLLADDLGWADVSFNGGAIETPNIDRISQEGVRLDRFYVAPICSPTRAGLLTGRYPIRFGAMRAVFPPWRQGGMDTSETTIADVLGAAGYEHRGVFGKWHLGHSDVKYHPLRRGFTEFYGHYNGAIDYFTHDREGEVDWHAGYEPNDDQGYTTDLIADAAVRFIREHADESSPFLAYVPFNAPHSPFQAKEEYLPMYSDLAAVQGNWTGNSEAPPQRPSAQQIQNRRILGAMIHSLDEGVGRILDALDEAGVTEDTLVIFSSDNGGVGAVGENAPLRGAKQSVFEGGIRVPASARWPGKIPAGSVTVAPLANIDVLPTLMRVAGVEGRGVRPLDGIDALDVLTGDTPVIDRDLYNYIGQAGLDQEQISYTTSEWKLVVMGPAVIDETANENARRRYLFKIREDPYEERDIAADHPDVVTEMYKKLKAFRALQPADAIPAYGEGQDSGFVAPERWRMPGQ